MRFVFALVMALGLLIALGASAGATGRHVSRSRPHGPVDRGQTGVGPGPPEATSRFAVPGWSDGSTRQWLDKASSLVGVGG